MIIYNGTIQAFLDDQNPPLDTEGYPSAQDGKWGVKIRCGISTRKRDETEAVNSSAYTEKNYTALFETQPFKAERVRLCRDNGEDLGEFAVINIEPNPHVGAIRINV